MAVLFDRKVVTTGGVRLYQHTLAADVQVGVKTGVRNSEVVGIGVNGTTRADAWPLRPGESLVMTLSNGDSVYAIGVGVVHIVVAKTVAI